MLALLEQTSETSAAAVGMMARKEPIRVPAFGMGAQNARAPWRSYAVSIAIHCCAIMVVLLVCIPVAQAIRRAEKVMLIAPNLSRYEPPKPRRIPVPVVRSFVPNVPPPPRPAPQMKVAITAPPVILEQPEVAPALAKPVIQTPAPPRPQVVAGVFARAEAARAPQPVKQIVPAGFGDPQGVPARAQTTSAPNIARLGSFDVPASEHGTGGLSAALVGATSFGSVDGAIGSHGTGRTGSIRAGGFGEGSGSSTPGGTARSTVVRTAGFGDSSAQPRSTPQRASTTPPASTPAEILFKPKPSYTEEARNLKVEGQVSLEVTFRADGSIQILRVIHGLGHGLDEAATEAARQVRFRPATHAGTPVDVNATLYITFQLT